MKRVLGRLALAFLFWAGAVAAGHAQLLVPQHRLPGAMPQLGFKSEGLPVEVNQGRLDGMRPGDEIDFVLPNAAKHTFVMELAESHGDGIKSWVARHKQRGNHNRAIITTGPAGSYGVISTPDGEFRIVPGGGQDWLVDMTAEQEHLPLTFLGDDGLLPPTHKSVSQPWNPPTIFVPLAGVNSLPVSKAAPSPTYEVDLMFVYTKGLADALGGNLMTRLYFLVTRANTSYVDSEVAIRLRLVNATMVNYSDTTTDNAALDAVSPAQSAFNAAVFGNIETIRAQYGADVVAFLRNGSAFGGSGLAWVGGFNGSAFDARYMYSVTTGCTQGCESVFIHEVGHNMGNKHDRATTQWQGGGTPTPQGGAYGYSFGYAYCGGGRGLNCNPSLANSLAGSCGTSQPECGGYPPSSNNHPDSFSDIMAYFHGSTSRIYKFSNPNINCAAPSGQPFPCGVSESSASSANTALSMNNSRAAISAVKAAVVSPGASPGAIQFTATAFGTSESAGSVNVTVSRVGGTSGSVAVSYATADGSATAGQDYTAKSGTLTWADGDSANKTITISITNDSIAEGGEAFSVALTNPTGGAFLGSPSSASVVIYEAWPPGSTLPAGFSSTDWTVATDQTYEGGTSLRSGAPIASSIGSYVNSDLTFTGTFVAGTVGFAYRASTWRNAGYVDYQRLEFAIDGTTVMTDGGETGWKFVTFQVTAGTHTLRWRLTNGLNAPCGSGWNPPAPGGSACADRAWIDAVVLPLSLNASTTTLASSRNPASPGQSVTFTATVSAGAGGTPSGTVAFSDGAAPISGCTAQALASGIATCTTSSLSTGVHAIAASYGGSSAHASSTSSTLSQVVAGTQLLAANPASLDFGGQSMNTTAPTQTTTITNTSGGTVIVTSVTPPTGYSVAANTCATLVVNATCTITIAFTPGSEGVLPGVLAVSYAGGGPTTVALTGTGEKSLVTHYYRSILRRAPDTGGKAFWESEAARVQGLGANVNEVWFALAQSFYFSAEYLGQNRDNNGYVTDLYNTFFNRAPDAGGLAYWTGQLSQGLPREVVLVGFMLSPEFTAFTQAIFGAVATRKEIDTVVDFYRGLLSRLPDSAGFNYWLGLFRTAQCQGAAAVNTQVEAISSAYANSPEYAGRNRSNTQFMADMYNAFMRRAGDLAGVQFWIGQLNTGAQTRDAVRRTFIQTPEFQARVAQVIAQGCMQ